MNPNQNTTNSQDVNEKIDPLNETEAQTTQQSEAECQNQALVIEQLQRQINELQTELTSTKQNERDSVLRAKAEVENMRRRADMDVEKAHKFALEKFASSLLPVVDTLERGIELADQTNSEKDTLREGMELTLKALLDVLDKFGIVAVNDCNVPFNPEFHEAMTVMESAEHQPNHIMMVLQKGYSLNGRLLRPARVAISK